MFYALRLVFIIPLWGLVLGLLLGLRGWGYRGGEVGYNWELKTSPNSGNNMKESMDTSTVFHVFQGEGGTKNALSFQRI